MAPVHLTGLAFERVNTPLHVDVVELLKHASLAEGNEAGSVDDPGVVEDDVNVPSACPPPLPPPPVAGVADSGGERKQSHSNAKRKRKRDQEKEELGPTTKPFAIRTHAASAQAVETDLDAKALPATSCGYSAKNYKPPKDLVPAEICDLLKEGYELIENDGYSCKVITTPDGTIVAVAAGQPRDPTYLADAHKVCDAMLAAGSSMKFLPKHLNHKRGAFPAVNVGVTHSKGTTQPVFLNLGSHAEAIDKLLAMPELRRMVAFANSSFKMWAPKLFDHYRSYIQRLFEAMPHLRRIFRHSVFPSCAFNFGPQVCTVSHRDQLNLSYGLCAIQALGQFNPKTSAHLVLDDVKKIIEFPAGSLMLIPSAVFAHRNLGVGEGETRLSFTQYCAGGIFRFIDNGFQTEASLREADPQAYAAVLERKRTRWRLGLSLWSTLEEIVASLTVTKR